MSEAYNQNNNLSITDTLRIAPKDNKLQNNDLTL